MQRDFDDFDDEHEYLRLNHYDNLDQDQYGEYYDPNEDFFYDLDVFSLEHAKAIFHGIGDLSRYKGFNRVGHKCAEGVKKGCSQQESKELERLESEMSALYANVPFRFFDDPIEQDETLPDANDPYIMELSKKIENLKEKCLFGPCEPCTKEEYDDYLKSKRDAQKDSTDDLYHPNNQTILDATVMPNTPVDPERFLTQVARELSKNNVLISDDMPELLKQMCRLFNFSIKPNQVIPRTVKNLVFPAQTGIGKSVSVQVYVSMLKTHSSMIVVSKVEEAIAYCNYINTMSSDTDYARCYYALTDKNKSNPMRVEAHSLKNYRCIVITHNMFRRVNGFDDVESFKIHNGIVREFISIDEKLNFHERYKLSYRALDQLIANLEESIKCCDELKELSTSNEVLQSLNEFKQFLLVKDDKIITDDHSIVIKEYLGKDLASEINALGEDLVFSEQSKNFPKKMVGLKNKEAVLQKLHSMYIGTQARRRKVVGVSFIEILRSIKTIETINDFYCSRVDSKLGNCLPVLNKNTQNDPRMNFLGDEFDPEYYALMKPTIDEFYQKEEERLKQEEKDGIYYEQNLKLTATLAKVMLETRLNSLFTSMEALGANKNPNYKQSVLFKINELITSLKFFSDNHFLIYKTNYETALLATENITHQLGVSVVLDATAQINQYYQLANRFLGHVAFVKAPQIRQYKNLTIHKAIGFSQSMSAIFKGKNELELTSNAQAYASYALNILNENDKLLIICHKGFKPALKRHLTDKRVRFTHWGDHIGKNHWSDCNKVMIIGWYYLNPSEYVCSINSALESVLLTSRHLDDELMETFQVSQLADDMVQGLMRSQARVIASLDNDCKPTSFYIFYKDDERSKKVLDLVETQFPKAKIIDWIPLGEKLKTKKTKPNAKADQVIELLILKAKNHQTYLRTEVQEQTSINKSTMSRILKSQYFLDKLEENGFIFKNKDGKSQHFILN